MIEMRWLTWVEELVAVPSGDLIQSGRANEVTLGTHRKLQYRQLVDTTVRAGLLNNAPPTLQWSEWKDVPEIPRDTTAPAVPALVGLAGHFPKGSWG